MICEKCNNEHNGNYGSGRFCSKKCANIRNGGTNKGKKYKISYKTCKQCNKKISSNNFSNHICNKQYNCEKCGTDFFKDFNFKKGTKIHCDDCKRKVNHVMENPSTILSLSKRTILKILKRAKIKCGMCGWDKTTLDLHHVLERKNGGSDSHSNLAPICPNCHRMAHEGKYTKEQLNEITLDKVLPNWKDFYNP